MTLLVRSHAMPAFGATGREAASARNGQRGAAVMHPLGCIPWEASAVLERHRYDTFKPFSSSQTVYVAFTGKCNP